MASSTDPGRAGPGLLSSVLLLLVLAWLSGPVGAVSERGKWIIDIDNKTLKENNLFNFTKTLFSNSSIHLKLVAETCNSSAPFRLNISWYLRNSHCYNEISKINAKYYFRSTKVQLGGGSGYYVFHQYPEINCQAHFGLDTFDVKTRLRDHLLQTTTEKTSGLTKREVVPPKPKAAASAKEGASAETGKAAVPSKKKDAGLDVVAESWEDGPYMFILNIREIKDPANPPHALEPTPAGQHGGSSRLHLSL
ncbi:transmembrane protein 87A-like [Lates japonicus]